MMCIFALDAMQPNQISLTLTPEQMIQKKRRECELLMEVTQQNITHHQTMIIMFQNLINFHTQDLRKQQEFLSEYYQAYINLPPRTDMPSTDVMHDDLEMSLITNNTHPKK